MKKLTTQERAEEMDRIVDIVRAIVPDKKFVLITVELGNKDEDGDPMGIFAVGSNFGNVAAIRETLKNAMDGVSHEPNVQVMTEKINSERAH